MDSWRAQISRSSRAKLSTGSKKKGFANPLGQNEFGRSLGGRTKPKNDEVDEEGQNDEDYPEDEEGDEGEQDEKGENKDQSTPVGWADTYSNPDSDKAIRPFSPTGLSPADTRTDGWPKTQHPELPYNFQESSLISQPGQFSRVSFFRLRKQVLHQ
jgi:hypothetical protein